MIRHLLKLSIVCCIISSVLAGCGYKDIDKRFFAVSIGVDFNEDNEEKPYKITLALAVPSTKIEPKSAITQIESIDAVNISEGLRQMKTKLDKELDLGHCKVIIIGEALAKQDVTELVYWIARRRDVQNIAALAIGKPTAEKIVSVNPESDRFSGNTLNFFFSSDTTESSYTYLATFTEMFKRLKEPGLDPILPIITAEDDSTYVVNSVALLDKQKIKLVLSPRETQLFNQLGGHLSQSSIYGSYEYDEITMTINKIKTSYEINEMVAQPEINMKIKQSVIIEELPSELNEDKNISYSQLMDKMQKQYSQESIALFEKIRDAELDPYGFGLRYRAKHPLLIEQYEEIWPSLYKEVAFNVHTKMDLKSTGLLK